jgi:pyridoxal phosphate enzyme (YggS family)
MSLLIETNIAKVLETIRSGEEKYLRQANSVTLMAVTKTRSADDIRQAAAAGIYHVGENYISEALEKTQQLQDLDLCWHFIGPIQSNKTRAIAEHFDWVHSVDRLKIAQRLNNQRPAQLPALKICLQVNISRESSKAGISLKELAALAGEVAKLPRLELRGLMAIPRATEDFAQQRESFAQLHKAFKELQPDHRQMDTLSMGMSGDMAAAIAEGATLVRIGTDIFGQRIQRQ